MKKGETIIMYFRCFGLVSEEEWTILKVDNKKNIIYLDNGCDEPWEFNMKNGKCINDNDAFGGSRYIDTIFDRCDKPKQERK